MQEGKLPVHIEHSPIPLFIPEQRWTKLITSSVKVVDGQKVAPTDDMGGIDKAKRIARDTKMGDK